jgi:hypothetical protein
MPNNTETSKNLTRQLTLDELIYSQEGSPANPTPSLESERERRTNATCGQRCCALFENAPRATSWAKTFAALLVGMEGWSSKRCALTWKLVGTPFNRSYFQLLPSVLPTDEIASGLLPTVKTLDSHKQRKLDENGENTSQTTGQKYGIHLTQMAEAGMLPTPTAFDYNTPRSQESWDKAKEKHGDALQNPLKQMAAFGMLPTPKCQEERGNASKDRGKFNLTDEVARIWQPPGKTSQLSPLFVEEMMGFPKNWTASPFQSGDENPSKPTATPSSLK